MRFSCAKSKFRRDSCATADPTPQGRHAWPSSATKMMGSTSCALIVLTAWQTCEPNLRGCAKHGHWQIPSILDCCLGTSCLSIFLHNVFLFICYRSCRTPWRVPGPTPLLLILDSLHTQDFYRTRSVSYVLYLSYPVILYLLNIAGIRHIADQTSHRSRYRSCNT